MVTFGRLDPCRCRFLKEVNNKAKQIHNRQKEEGARTNHHHHHMWVWHAAAHGRLIFLSSPPIRRTRHACRSIRGQLSKRHRPDASGLFIWKKMIDLARAIGQHVCSVGTVACGVIYISSTKVSCIASIHSKAQKSSISIYSVPFL